MDAESVRFDQKTAALRQYTDRGELLRSGSGRFRVDDVKQSELVRDILKRNVVRDEVLLEPGLKRFPKQGLCIEIVGIARFCHVQVSR